jgi:hypothetical protein
MKRLYCSLATLLMLCLATTARAYDFAPVSDPQALGFSSSRLDRIAAWQQSQVDAGTFSKKKTRMSVKGHSRRFWDVYADSALPPIATGQRTC